MRQWTNKHQIIFFQRIGFRPNGIRDTTEYAVAPKMLTNSIMSHSPCAGSGTRDTFFTPDNQSYNCHAFLNINEMP